MKRGLIALLLSTFLIAACSGAPASHSSGDPYRFSPGQADPHVPIGGM